MRSSVNALATRTGEFSDLFQRAQGFIEAPAVKQLPHPFPFTARVHVSAPTGGRSTTIIDAEMADRRAHPTGDPLDVLEVWSERTARSADAEIRDQVVTLMGAGYDTTSAWRWRG